MEEGGQLPLQSLLHQSISFHDANGVVAQPPSARKLPLAFKNQADHVQCDLSRRVQRENAAGTGDQDQLSLPSARSYLPQGSLPGLFHDRQLNLARYVPVREPREEIRYLFLQYIHQVRYQQPLKDIPAPNGCYVKDRQRIWTQEEKVQRVSEPRRINREQV